MTSKEAKALIGRAIKYTKIHSSYIYWNYATVLSVQGKNMEVDEMGMKDWIWLPDVHIVPIAPGISSTSGKDLSNN
jgi:hypothetical protein